MGYASHVAIASKQNIVVSVQLLWKKGLKLYMQLNLTVKFASGVVRPKPFNLLVIGEVSSLQLGS